MTVKIIVSILLTALILATWLANELQEVTITCYDVNTAVVTTVRPTGRQFVVQFQHDCDIFAGEISGNYYSLTEALRRV